MILFLYFSEYIVLRNNTLVVSVWSLRWTEDGLVGKPKKSYFFRGPATKGGGGGRVKAWPLRKN